MAMNPSGESGSSVALGLLEWANASRKATTKEDVQDGSGLTIDNRWNCGPSDELLVPLADCRLADHLLLLLRHQDRVFVECVPSSILHYSLQCLTRSSSK